LGIARSRDRSCKIGLGSSSDPIESSGKHLESSSEGSGKDPSSLEVGIFWQHLRPALLISSSFASALCVPKTVTMVGSLKAEHSGRHHQELAERNSRPVAKEKLLDRPSEPLVALRQNLR
jgi:hypothetical protein